MQVSVLGAGKCIRLQHTTWSEWLHITVSPLYLPAPQQKCYVASSFGNLPDNERFGAGFPWKLSEDSNWECCGCASLNWEKKFIQQKAIQRIVSLNKDLLSCRNLRLASYRRKYEYKLLWMIMDGILSQRSRNRLLIQTLMGPFDCRKILNPLQTQAFVVILQNFQPILLQV